MPTFIDSHPMGDIKPESFRLLQRSPEDEFGVTHHDILFNSKEDRVYCILEAPNREAVIRHHSKAMVKCDFILEVESAKK